MIKVLIVAELKTIKECLCGFFEEEINLKVIGCISNEKEMIKFCSIKEPDLIIMHIGMKENTDYSVIRRIKSVNKNIRIIVFSLSGDKKNILLALKNGADSYLINDESIREVLAVMGNSYGKVKYIYKNNCYNAKRNSYDYRMFNEVNFTDREKDVLELVSEGFTNHEIAAELGISVGRSRNIVADLIAKCMVKNRTQLAVLAVKINMHCICK